MSFCALRLDAHAQWEIRDLAGAMLDALAEQGAQWAEIAGWCRLPAE